jgi:DNA-binding CsgD family transcriptional regulator
MKRIAELSEDLVLISEELCFPAQRALTAAEQLVAALAVQGLSNEEIARIRGCSPSTVAKQLAASYQKLSLNGRRELRAKLTGA